MDNVKINYNTNAIKFIAACLVIIGHAHSLSIGEPDWLARLTLGQLSCGSIAVSIFFALSGYYITKSIFRYKSSAEYLVQRCKRIFPLLWGVVLFTVFVLGPINTNLELKEYFTDSDTYLYLLNAILIPVHNLPEVFTKCQYMSTVNGALWTLPVEFICYIALLILYKLGLLEKKKIFLAIPIFCIFAIGIWNAAVFLKAEILIAMIYPMISFLTGIFLRIYSQDVYCKGYLRFGIYFLLIVLSLAFQCAEKSMYILVPILVMELINSLRRQYIFIGKLGEYSYGIYLVGFPIQQFAVCMFGGGDESLC